MKKLQLLSLFGVLLLSSCGGSGSGGGSSKEVYTKMSQAEFDALIAKINNEGFGIELSIVAKAGDTVIQDMSSVYKFNVPNLELYGEGYVNDTLAYGSCLKESTVYGYDQGKWVKENKLDAEKTNQYFNMEFQSCLLNVFPCSDYSKYTFNSSDGSYTFNGSIEGQPDYVFNYVYKMDKTTIAELNGTLTGTSKQYGTVVQTIKTKSITLGAQSITAPEVNITHVKNQKFVCTSIKEYDQYKDVTIIEGITYGDLFDDYIGCPLTFADTTFSITANSSFLGGTVIATGDYTFDENSGTGTYTQTKSIQGGQESEIPVSSRVTMNFSLKDNIVTLEAIFEGLEGNLAHLLFELDE